MNNTHLFLQKVYQFIIQTLMRDCMSDKNSGVNTPLNNSEGGEQRWLVDAKMIEIIMIIWYIPDLTLS